MTKTIAPPANQQPFDAAQGRASALRLVRAARELYRRGLIVGLDGNLSLRLPDGSILITPSGQVKGWLRPADLLRIDLRGRVLDGPIGRRPSSEIAMHLVAYRERSDIGAVVHAHPPAVVACSVFGLPLLSDALPEALLLTGSPILLPYATPGTAEGAAALAAQVHEGDCFVLERHGSLAVAADIDLAFARTESLEQLARISLQARQLGFRDPQALALDAARQASLAAVRAAMGWGMPAGRPAEDAGAGPLGSVDRAHP